MSKDRLLKEPLYVVILLLSVAMLFLLLFNIDISRRIENIKVLMQLETKKEIEAARKAIFNSIKPKDRVDIKSFESLAKLIKEEKDKMLSIQKELGNN